MKPSVTPDPAGSCPPAISALQIALAVPYLTFDGRTEHGWIEVHRHVADDVTAFFAYAFERRFPIARVVRAPVIRRTPTATTG